MVYSFQLQARHVIGCTHVNITDSIKKNIVAIIRFINWRRQCQHLSMHIHLQREATIWNNAGLLFIGLLGTNFSETPVKIQTFSFNKKHLKILSEKWRPFVSASMS